MPRQHDIGHALHLAQQLRVFIQKPQRPGLPFRVIERRGQPPCFESLHVVEIVRFLRERLTLIEK